MDIIYYLNWEQMIVRTKLGYRVSFEKKYIFLFPLGEKIETSTGFMPVRVAFRSRDKKKFSRVFPNTTQLAMLWEEEKKGIDTYYVPLFPNGAVRAI